MLQRGGDGDAAARCRSSWALEQQGAGARGRWSGEVQELVGARAARYRSYARGRMEVAWVPGAMEDLNLNFPAVCGIEEDDRGKMIMGV